MEFKCKNCNSTKYRQISASIKQCEECGMLTQSKGAVDPKVLDFTEEEDETKQKKEINPKLGFGQYRVYKRIEPDGMTEWYLETLYNL